MVAETFARHQEEFDQRLAEQQRLENEPQADGWSLVHLEFIVPIKKPIPLAISVFSIIPPIRVFQLKNFYHVIYTYTRAYVILSHKVRRMTGWNFSVLLCENCFFLKTKLILLSLVVYFAVITMQYKTRRNNLALTSTMRAMLPYLVHKVLCHSVSLLAQCDHCWTKQKLLKQERKYNIVGSIKNFADFFSAEN